MLERDVERVPRMHELARLVGGPEDIGDVVDDRDLGMDDGMPAAGETRGERTDLDLVPAARGRPRAGHVVVVELLGRLGIGVEDRVGVRGYEVGQLRDVAVVGMLVGDQDRVEIVDAVEPVREVPRVEEHLGPVDLDEQTGMAEVGDLHDSTVPVQTTTGKKPHPNAASRIRTKP